MFRLAVFLILSCAASLSQKPDAHFTVASVKPVSLDSYHGGPLYPQIVGGRFRCFCSLLTLISYATGMRRDEVTISREIKESDLYEVSATFPEPERGRLQQMVYALLEERFRFSAHKETRQTRIYALLVDKQGLKLKPATRPPVSRPDLPETPTRSAIKFVISGSMDRLNFEGSGTLDDFVLFLGRLDRPVINLTGISGRFDFALDAIVPTARPPLVFQDGTVIQATADKNDPGGPGSIFTEIRKLGLVLEPRRVTAVHLTVDYVDRNPTTN